MVPVIAAVTADGMDLGAAGILRNAQEHHAAAEFEIARPLSKAEDRVRAEAGERLIGKGQFGTGFDTGAHCGAVAHFVADGRGPGGGLRGQQFDVFDDLTDARLLEFGGARRKQGKAGKQKNQTVLEESGSWRPRASRAAWSRAWRWASLDLGG